MTSDKLPEGKVALDDEMKSLIENNILKISEYSSRQNFC